MRTLAQHTGNIEVYRKTNKLLLTSGMIVCLTAGWFLGHSFSQINKGNDSYFEKNIILPSIPVNGEALPTIILSEIEIVSSSK